MKPSQALALHRDAIRRVVESNRATNPRVFGSVLHGQDTDSSDLDKHVLYPLFYGKGEEAEEEESRPIVFALRALHIPRL